MTFNFFKRRFKGPVVDLISAFDIKPSKDNGYVPSYFYNIVLHDTNVIVGRCDLRVGYNEELYYLGNIGYSVRVQHRGHRYAYHACKILFQIAKEEYEMDELIITCNPDNVASLKTLERLSGEYLGVFDVPSDHYCYSMKEFEKCIYRYQL